MKGLTSTNSHFPILLIFLINEYVADTFGNILDTMYNPYYVEILNSLQK